MVFEVGERVYQDLKNRNGRSSNRVTGTVIEVNIDLRERDPQEGRHLAGYRVRWDPRHDGSPRKIATLPSRCLKRVSEKAR